MRKDKVARCEKQVVAKKRDSFYNLIESTTIFV